MAPFAVTVDARLTPEVAWARLTDWPAHARHVPLTTIRVATAGPTTLGTVFVARTAIGRLGVDDPMEVVAWHPPRFCRIEKRGTAVRGWAELTVEPRAAGVRITWREEAIPARLPRYAERAATAAGRALFGRVVRGLLGPAAID